MEGSFGVSRAPCQGRGLTTPGGITVVRFWWGCGEDCGRMEGFGWSTFFFGGVVEDALAA